MSGEARQAAEAAYPSLNLLIGGEWSGAGERSSQEVIDPSTGKVLGLLPIATPSDVERAVMAAADSFDAWRRTPVMERSRILRSTAANIRAERATLANLISLELGKPLSEAMRETETACEMFEWAAEEARRLYGRTIPSRTPDMRMTAMRTPVGPAGAISGWNAPSITPSRKIAAALGAGCTLVLKPSEATPATAQFVVRAVQEAGAPAGVVNLIFGDPAETVRRLVDHPALRLISFTGATDIGRQLAARAALTLKRTVFELGGHAPALIFEDVDVEATARAAAATKFRNSGQVCTSPTRFLVARPIFDRFRDSFVGSAAAIKIGDPFEPGMAMGPLQNPRRVEAIASLVADAVSRGASLLTGGEAIERPGFWYRPTVLADMPLAARAMNEEPFGPLAMLAPFDTVDEAIAEANRLPYGLAGYAATNDLRIAERVASELQCGTLAVNNWTASYAETPFGGVKDSGVGTEGGPEGIAAFLQTRFVSVAF